MEIGNIIKPIEGTGFHLRSGANYYKKAVVISLEPFIITSEDADMKWEATIKKEYFEVIGQVDLNTLVLCKSRLPVKHCHNYRSNSFTGICMSCGKLHPLSNCL